MKTQKLISISLTMLLIMTAYVSASSSNFEPEKNKRLKNYINNHINYPETNHDLSGFVLVQYNIDKDGNVTIDAINASNPDLEEHVKSSFQKISRFPAASELNTSFTCKYVFVPQEENQSLPKSKQGIERINGINNFIADLEL